MAALIAFDTATERMTIAVKGDGERVWSHEAEGGAKASAALLPAILGLLRDAGLGLADLDADTSDDGALDAETGDGVVDAEGWDPEGSEPEGFEAQAGHGYREV